MSPIGENQPQPEQSRVFRILSIDGGGIKGVFPAAFLAELEKALPAPVASYFDLIAGTSTGGIIALGLGLGVRPLEITNFYEKFGPRIFAKPWWRGGFFEAKYDATELEDALRDVFREKTMGDSQVRLLIPSFNASNGEIHIYKTRHHARFLTDYKVSAVDVALATTAAPIYFRSHAGAGGALYVDGGVWANNPVGNAVVEAVSWLGRNPRSVRVLSLGCTQFPQSFAGLKGKVDWARKERFVEAFLRGQSGGSLGMAYSIVGHEFVKRVNPNVPPGAFSLDGVDAIPRLASHGYAEARKAISELMPMFFSEPAAPFIPEAL